MTSTIENPPFQGEGVGGDGPPLKTQNSALQTREVRDLPVHLVFPNPDQPRKFFDPVKLEELANSIREHGVQQPIKVAPRGDRYMIVMGERRWRASQLAGKQTIPAMVEDLTERQIDALSMIENLQRQDITAIEEARKYQDMISKGWTREELAESLGLKQQWRIDERLSLLKLTPEHQDLLAKGVIGNSEAFEMSRVSAEKQAIVLRKILAGELGSYNKLRAFVDGLLAIEDQAVIFSLTQITAEEQQTVTDFEHMVKAIETLIGRVYEGERRKHLEKVAFHTNITPERLDLIIQGLQKIRKTVLEGAGVKEAIAA